MVLLRFLFYSYQTCQVSRSDAIFIFHKWSKHMQTSYSMKVGTRDAWLPPSFPACPVTLYTSSTFTLQQPLLYLIYQPLPEISCRDITAATLHGCRNQQEDNLLLAQHQQTYPALGLGVFYREVNTIFKLASPLMYQHHSVNVSS